MLHAYGVSDKGPIRPINEDCFAVDDQLSLSVAADGMGGHNAGEVAARIAVDTVLEFCKAGLDISKADWPFGFDPGLSEAANLLRTSVHIANTRVLEAAGSSDEHSGMGTTVVAMMVRDGRLSIAHVGDSRLYLYSGDHLRLLTRDDSWMASVLSENPQVDPAMYSNHPMRNALTNVVGAEPRIEVHILDEALPANSIMVLTTDGVHGVVDHKRMEAILGEGNGPADIAANLVDAALARGSRDNCTAVVAQYLL